MFRARFAIVVFVTALIAACGGPEPPEERVRAFIDQVAASAESRSWLAFGNYIADGYSDERGHTKEEVLAMVARYILANQSFHIFKRISEIRIEDGGGAHAVVYAAMAGQAVSGPEDLARISADLYRFEIDLEPGEDGDFRVVRGDWKPATMEHFLLDL